VKSIFRVFCKKGYILGKITTKKLHIKNYGKSVRHQVGGDDKGEGKKSVFMSSTKPVFVSVMYWPRARLRWGSVHSMTSCLREETSFSRRSQTLVRAGQVRMACWKDSGSIPQRGQHGPGFSSNQ